MIGADLKVRVISGLVMALAAIVSEIAGGWWFALFWIAVFAAVVIEWQKIIAPKSDIRLVAVAALAVIASGLMFQAGFPLIAFAPLGIGAILVGSMAKEQKLHATLGLAYAGLPLLSVIWLRSAEPNGMVVVAWVFGIVWSADVAAYFTGRALGGPKLWPSVSPKKTWSGFIGGTLGGALVASFVLWAFSVPVGWALLLLAGCLAVLSAGGDLYESALKRRFGVKDSSALIPGHGGLMDRVDGFIAVVIGAAVFALLRGGDPGLALLVWQGAS
jgi:phosphatidate cytidylyltransferase